MGEDENNLDFNVPQEPDFLNDGFVDADDQV